MRNRLTGFVLTTLILAAAGTADALNTSIGIRIGYPPSPRAYQIPPTGPDYEWMEGSHVGSNDEGLLKEPHRASRLSLMPQTFWAGGPQTPVAV